MRKITIRRNIGLLMEHFGIRNESQLAKLVGMAQTTINKLTTGSTEDPRVSTLLPIVQHFNISLDDLLSDNPSFVNHNNKRKATNYPLIPVVAYTELVDLYDSLGSLNTENWPTWYPIPKNNLERYFALYLNNAELPEPFAENSALVIKKSEVLEDHSYCLVRHLPSKALNIKKTYFENGQPWLLSLQKELPPSVFDNKAWELLGIITAKITNLSSNNRFIQIGA